MGIHNLIKYINIKNPINLAQCESGNNIYISNIVYFDMTYKLIEIYNKFMYLSNKIDVDFEFRISELLRYTEEELLNMFTRLKNFNRIIYVFIDYKFMNNLKERNIVFKDFLNMNIEDHERVNSIPMIKRKYLKLLDDDKDEYDTMKYLIKKIRCMFELKSIYSVSNKLDIEKYISIPYLIKIEKNEEKHKKLSMLLDEGKFRYLILRGGKYLVRKQRGKGLFSFFSSETDFSLSPGCNEKNISPCDNESTSFNVDKLLFNSVSKNGIEKLNEFNNYIPFTIIIYLFPMFVKKINFDNVKFFGCEIESDFALSKHVHTYSKNAFPTIYSSDTDMLCLMCDVDCIIKLSIKNNRQKNLKNTKIQEITNNTHKFYNDVNDSDNLTFYINPVAFWQGIFKCKLSARIIKILCVLMGTDYNPYHSKSPIHIRHFHDILKILNVDKFENIDEDILLAKIYVIMKNNENDIHCKQTAIALNMYLNELEGEMHFITKNTNVNKIDMPRFLKYSKRTIFA